MYTVKLTRKQLKAMLILTGNCAGLQGSCGVYLQLAALDEALADELVNVEVTTEPFGDSLAIRLPQDLTE